MKIGEKCEKCTLERQRKRVQNIEDAQKREGYLAEVEAALANRDIEEDCSPYMVYVFNQIYKKYFGMVPSFREEKKKYNALVMAMEEEIERKICASEDPLETSMIYARIGNYIDFGAMDHVDQKTFLELLDKENKGGLDSATYKKFCRECESGKQFVLLCDNCGEVVLDKLFVKQLKHRFPHLDIYVMVRGEEVLNDATMEDAVFCGMDQVAKVVSNGSGAAGTVLKVLSREARNILDGADVILAKGQGNYESLSGCGIGAYYSFLCKCELFITRFQVPALTGMFVYEIG